MWEFFKKLVLDRALDLALKTVKTIAEAAVSIGGVVLKEVLDKGVTLFTQGDGMAGVARAMTHGFEGWLQEGISKQIIGIDNMLGDSINLKGEDFSPYGSIAYWDKILSIQKDVNLSLGIAGELGRNLQSNFSGALAPLARLGVEAKEVAADYKKFIEETGRNQELTTGELVNFGELRAVYGNEASNIFSYFNNLGVSVSTTTKSLKKLMKESQDMGLNSTAVMKTLSSNIGIIDRFTFAKGRKGIEEMAKMAVKTKIEMAAIAGLADNILDGGIEGAIEMGANLQMLGGDMALLGNGFDLYAMASTNPEEFAKKIQEATRGVAQFNSETGEMDIDFLGMSRLRGLAKALNIDISNLTKTSKAFGTEMEIKDLFDSSIKGASDFKEILTKVSGAATFDNDMNQWVVAIKGVKRSIESLTSSDIGQMKTLDVGVTVEDSMKNLIESNETLGNRIQRAFDSFKLTAISKKSYEAFDDFIKPIASDSQGWLAPMADAFRNLGDRAGLVFERFLDTTTNFLNNPSMETAAKVGWEAVKNSLDVGAGILNMGFEAFGSSMTDIVNKFVDLYNYTLGWFFPNLPEYKPSKDKTSDMFTPITPTVNDGVVFNPNDELLTVASTQKGQLTQAVENMTGARISNGMNNTINGSSDGQGSTHTFTVKIRDASGNTQSKTLSKNDVREIIFDAWDGVNSSGGISSKNNPYS